MVPNRCGNEGVKAKTLNTVIWQQKQISHVDQALLFLFKNGYLLQVFDQDLKCESLGVLNILANTCHA